MSAQEPLLQRRACSGLLVCLSEILRSPRSLSFSHTCWAEGLRSGCGHPEIVSSLIYSFTERTRMLLFIKLTSCQLVGLVHGPLRGLIGVAGSPFIAQLTTSRSFLILPGHGSQECCKLGRQVQHLPLDITLLPRTEEAPALA